MRNRFSRAAILAVIGSTGLVGFFQRPRVQAFHTVDILLLLASGMCFGVALALLLMVRIRR